MSYENSAACRSAATSCVACGRALVDAVSVEAGVGPICRKKYGYDVDVPEENRAEANRLIYRAALDETSDTERLEIANAVADLGFVAFADKIRKRFGKGAVRLVVERVVFGKGKYAREDHAFVVRTPYEGSVEFNASLKELVDWRDRKPLFDGEGEDKKWRGWAVRNASAPKKALFTALKRAYEGRAAEGPKGFFVI